MENIDTKKERYMEEKRRTITKWIYWFSFAVAVIAVYKTLDNFSMIGVWLKNLINVLMPFIFGTLIAYLLYVPCRKLEHIYAKAKKTKIIAKKARPLSVFTIYFIVIILLIVSFNFLIPVIANSVIDLVNHSQEYYNSAMQNLENMPEDSILKNESVTDIINSVRNINIKQFINMDKLAEYAKGAIDIATKVFDFFVAIVVSVYILLQRREILDFIRKMGQAILKENTYPYPMCQM